MRLSRAQRAMLERAAQIERALGRSWTCDEVARDNWGGYTLRSLLAKKLVELGGGGFRLNRPDYREVVP